MNHLTKNYRNTMIAVMVIIIHYSKATILTPLDNRSFRETNYSKTGTC